MGATRRKHNFMTSPRTLWSLVYPHLEQYLSMMYDVNRSITNTLSKTSLGSVWILTIIVFKIKNSVHQAIKMLNNCGTSFCQEHPWSCRHVKFKGTMTKWRHKLNNKLLLQINTRFETFFLWTYFQYISNLFCTR